MLWGFDGRNGFECFSMVCEDSVSFFDSILSYLQ